MSTIPTSLSRVSSALSSDLLLSNLRRSNVELLRTQAQLSTGLKVNQPSDAPDQIGLINSLRVSLDRFTQQLENLDRAGTFIDVTDSALGNVSNLLLEAQNVALSQIGITSDAQTRNSQAEIIDALIRNLFEIANREHQDLYLFGGRSSSKQPFVEQLGGIRYLGATDNLVAELNSPLPLEVNTNGNAALGALSGRVLGSVDLDPNATSDTRIADVNGARSLGVSLGSVRLVVDTGQLEVDLTTADTLGDVVNLINEAINSIDPTAGALSLNPDGYTLSANAGHTISIADIGAGVTAADLGIAIGATSGSTAGNDIDPRLTLLTDLSQLGVAVDFASGLKITNGGVSKVVDLSTATTVQDLINVVSTADVGARLRINAAGDGLDLVNEVSGTQLSIGENAGGTSASDLGLRSFDTSTLLADFNQGLGVRTVSGQADFRIELHDGTTIDVDVTGAVTVQDVMNRITAAAGAAPLTVGLAADGNGLLLSDGSAGAGSFRVININNSFAAADLGIKQNAGAGNTINGADNATIDTDSVFSHLIMLRDAMRNNDTRLITLAAEKIKTDIQTVASARAGTGVRAQRVESERQRILDRQVKDQTLLSAVRDTDYAEAISRLTLIEQQLQATLTASARLSDLTLLNFLR